MNQGRIDEELSHELEQLRRHVGSLEGARAEQLAELDRCRQLEDELRKTNRALTALSQCNRSVFRAGGEAELLDEVCRVIVEEAHYRLAWVGFVASDQAKSIRPVAEAGFEEGYLETLHVTADSADPRGRGPVGTAARTAQPSITRDIHTDPGFAPWREEAVRRGYGSCMALPLAAGGAVFGTLAIYAPEPNAFGAEEIALLADLAENLSYGIAVQRDRAARRAAEQALAESKARLEAILHSIPDVIFILDEEGCYLDVLTSENALLRTAADQLLGRRVHDVMPREVADAILSAVREALATGRMQVLEYSLEVIAGLRWFEGRSTPIRDYPSAKPRALWVAHDITHRKTAEQALQRSHEELERRVLERTAELAAANDRLRKLLDVYEQHRKLVAYEIHDAVAQPLAAALMTVQGSLSQIDPQCPSPVKQGFHTASTLIQSTIDEARRLMSGLRPPILDEAGLVEAIEFLICELGREVDIRFRHEVHFDRLASPLETALFRAIQESLVNALRYSASPRIDIDLVQQDDRIHIRIEDWGKGFDPAHVERNRFGLEGIRERARIFGGRALIDSAPGAGTRVVLDFPLVES